VDCKNFWLIFSTEPDHCFKLIQLHNMVGTIEKLKNSPLAIWLALVNFKIPPNKKKINKKD